MPQYCVSNRIRSLKHGCWELALLIRNTLRKLLDDLHRAALDGNHQGIQSTTVSAFAHFTNNAKLCGHRKQQACYFVEGAHSSVHQGGLETRIRVQRAPEQGFVVAKLHQYPVDNSNLTCSASVVECSHAILILGQNVISGTNFRGLRKELFQNVEVASSSRQCSCCNNGILKFLNTKSMNRI